MLRVTGKACNISIRRPWPCWSGLPVPPGNGGKGKEEVSGAALARLLRRELERKQVWLKGMRLLEADATRAGD
ncbi:MAG: hypothetical protein GY862_02565 [Gammaproteobacteria bacterium]|nr:hypothetical protein [Gammaproteobacteria bacterium]